MVVEHKYDWTGKQILIVEDDDSSSFLLREILKRTGATLAFAFDGEEAIEYVRSHPETDIILMDIHLPHKDGLYASREIKKINPVIPIIAQSAYLNLLNLESSNPDETDDYVAKPINPSCFSLRSTNSWKRRR